MGKSKAINETEAREAVRTLIRWAGDDPDRPALQDTPARVLEFFSEFFTGYDKNAADYEGSIANDVAYDDFIMVRDITLASFCEHHMLPATGTAHIAYIPKDKVAGIGTIARIAEDCARRLSTQEAVTNDIAAIIDQAFAPQGVAVLVDLGHGCMTLRGGKQTQSRVTATKFTGAFKDNPALQTRFLMLAGKKCDTTAAQNKEQA